nr:hypothetical protein GCM10020092_055930 [Actinoplanes digitatis]
MSIVRPYGDTTGDGMVQLSFTLPIPHDKRAEGAAVQLANKMGMDPALLVHAKQMGDGFTFFVVYGRVSHLVDTEKVQVVERDFPLLSAKEVNAVIKRRLRRRLKVVGACIGTDAHTVGIDAILNLKGIAGGEGPGVLQRAVGDQHGRAGVGAGAGGDGPGGEGRRGAGVAGGDAARRAPAEHAGDVGGVPGGAAGGLASAVDRRRAALRRADG